MLWSCILLPQLAPEGQPAAIEALCLWALQWSSAVSARAAGADPDDPLRLTEATRSLGLVVLRGTAVMVVSPTDGMEEIANPFLAAGGEAEDA